jgi:hypothetical protein
LAQVEEDGSTTLGRAWAAGQSRFWTLFGIGILTALPVILVGLVMAVGIFLVAGGAAVAGARGNEGVAGVMAGLLACICPSVCLLIILVAVLAQIRIYAERAAILEGLGWVEAFSRGWRVLRSNLGTTILLWLVFVVLGLVIGGIAFAIMLPILLPVGALMANAGGSTPNAALLVPICGFGLLGIVVAAIIGAVVNTFTSATWTVAYREMTAPLAPPPSAAVIEG